MTSATDPLGAVTRYTYDADHWPTAAIGPDPDGSGPRRSRMTTYGYLASGERSSVTVGSANADGSGFTAAQGVTTAYDAASRPVREALVAGGTTYAVTRHRYDAALRLSCVAVRMDPASWSGQGDDCAPQPDGPAGPGQVTLTLSDPQGRTRFVTSGQGTADAATEYTSYTANGQVGSVTDANGNVTSQGYDGYDRATTTTYPGGSYERLERDANGNVVSRRLRDGQVLVYNYDALDRRTYDDNPNTGVAEVDVAYNYDLLGRVTHATDQNGWRKDYEYDALGRVTREGSSIGDNRFGYDLAGRRVRQAWADGFYVTDEYDAAGNMTAIRENGSGLLASFGYDDLGRRTSLTRGNGTTTTYGYDAVSRLATLSQDLAGTAQDVTYSYGYNPASQLVSRTTSNDAYAWKGHYNADQSYGVNALNQLTNAGSTALGYDARGNLTSVGSSSYGYNSRNQMTGAPGVQRLYRGPSGELGHLIEASGAPLLFDWAGGDLATETDGTVQRRYVHGPGTDEPLVWYEGSGTGDKRYFHADERGSIVAVSDATGNAIAVNTYDEYGKPGSGNIGRFGYTGQVWLPQVGLYDYKARMYSPSLGRFMQTDPIGYADGLNLYAYVHGDPVNNVDPSGMDDDDIVVTGKRLPKQRQDGNSGGNDIVVTGHRYAGAPFGAPSHLVTVKFNDSSGLANLANLPMTAAEAPPRNDDIVVTANRHRYVLRYLNPCSARSVFGYFKQAGHSAPGAPTAREGFTRRLVLTGGNPIAQFVNSATGTIINTTLSEHRYFPGTVTIQVTPNPGGQTSTTVITGEGTGAHSEENVILGEAFFGSQGAGAQIACGI